MTIMSQLRPMIPRFRQQYMVFCVRGWGEILPQQNF